MPGRLVCVVVRLAVVHAQKERVVHDVQLGEELHVCGQRLHQLRLRVLADVNLQAVVQEVVVLEKRIEGFLWSTIYLQGYAMKHIIMSTNVQACNGGCNSCALLFNLAPAEFSHSVCTVEKRHDTQVDLRS